MCGIVRLNYHSFLDFEMSDSKWVLAVLEDLRRYADQHGLIDLERQLERAGRTAAQELSERAGMSASMPASMSGPRIGAMAPVARDRRTL